MFAGFIILRAPFPSLSAEKYSGSSLFQSATPLRISVQIPDEGMEALRASRTARSPRNKPQARATIVENGRSYSNVAVQLKGFTSFQPVDRTPSLTLNFDKFVPGQRFRGFDKLSLNNSSQDASRLHEKLAREVFAAAGVPVPRADHALVTLNGRDLGLYVVTEGFDKQFLKRHFERSEGNLYDPGVLQDIDQPLQVDSGWNPTNHAGLQRLLVAARESDPVTRFLALEGALDMDRFLSMVAVETILCHSDSYSMNRNNYRIYHDPASDKMVFMPHGMDRVLGAHRSTLDLSIVPPTLGLVARAVLTTPEGRQRYVERAAILFTNIFDPEKLCRRVREIDAGIRAVRTNSPVDRRQGRIAPETGVRDADILCLRIADRAAELRVQLAHLADWIALTPSPIFDPRGVALLDGWKPRSRPGRSEVSCDLVTQDGQRVLCLRTSQGPLTVSLRNRISLSAGDYVVDGQIKISGGSANSVSADFLRNTTGRFGVERQRLDGRRIEFHLEIPESRAPEEVEFVCEVRSDSSEVRFDISSLRLIRLTK